MANVPVEVKKTAPAPTWCRMPETWWSFRHDMDRAFDRFSGFGLPGRRWFDVAPSRTYESSLKQIVWTGAASANWPSTMHDREPNVVKSAARVDLSLFSSAT
jgi:hypothetical protein